MILQHFSDRKIALEELFNYPAALQSLGMYEKPTGFWVSVKGKDDWPHWYKSQPEFRSHTFRFCHNIEIDFRGILVIDTPLKFIQFMDKYKLIIHNCTCIHWQFVARDYKGIIIAPYFWKYRFIEWYYTWDCASGCIWAARDVIKNIIIAEKA